MTTFAPHDPTLDERVRSAWELYRDRLSELQGAEYDAAESDAWEQLQDTLKDIAADSGEAPGDPGAQG